MVRTLCFHCGGCGLNNLIPGWGIKILQVCGLAKKKRRGGGIVIEMT